MLMDPAGVKAGVQGGMMLWLGLGGIELVFGLGGFILGMSMRRMMLAQRQAQAQEAGIEAGKTAPPVFHSVP